MRHVIGSLLLGAVLGCGAPTSTPTERDDWLVEPEPDGKAEGWGFANPAYHDRSFIPDVPGLPLEGRTRVSPWRGSNWPRYLDGINRSWLGDASPAEKAERAFGIPGFAALASARVGINAGTTSCVIQDDCRSVEEDVRCVSPREPYRDATRPSRCIPTWYGLCHAWAPAALLEPEPLRAVVEGGVVFQPADVAALLAWTYHGSLRDTVRQLGERCEAPPSDLDVDDDGRLVDDRCRDLNPGSLFVVLANLLGLRGTGLIVDRDVGREVWNLPVQRYRVTNGVDGALREVSAAEALALVGDPAEASFDRGATRFFHVELELEYVPIVEPSGAVVYPRELVERLAFVLEADRHGILRGGEWIGASRTAHPDFVWWPTVPPARAANPGVTYAQAHELAVRSASPPEPLERVLLADAVISRPRVLQVGIPATGQRRMTLVLTGARGNADLYARLGRLPSSLDDPALLRSTGPSSNERLVLTAPPEGGSYYVVVVPQSGRPAVTLRSRLE